MPVVLDILSPWPVVSTLVPHLEVGDLLSLARSSSGCRAILHGFPLPCPRNGFFSPDSSQLGDNDSKGSVRKDLYIGEHDTPQWKLLKRLAQLNCMETEHKKGPTPRPCLYCSMPVCEACIVKESFSTRNPLYKTRTCRLCEECWATKNYPSRSRFTPTPHSTVPPRSTGGDYSGGKFCNCIARDGWICSECRGVQCAMSSQSEFMCLGEGCSKRLEWANDRSRICLWCDLPLLGRYTQTDTWGSYGRRLTIPGPRRRRPPPQDEDLVLEVGGRDENAATTENVE